MRRFRFRRRRRRELVFGSASNGEAEEKEEKEEEEEEKEKPDFASPRQALASRASRFILTTREKRAFVIDVMQVRARRANLIAARLSAAITGLTGERTTKTCAPRGSMPLCARAKRIVVTKNKMMVLLDLD